MEFLEAIKDRGRVIFVTIMNTIFWLLFVPLAFAYGEIINVFKRKNFLEGIFKNTFFAALLAVYWFSPAAILSYVASTQVSVVDISNVSLGPYSWLFLPAGILGLIATIVYPISLLAYAYYGKRAFDPKVIFALLKYRFFPYIKEWALWIVLSALAFFILYLVPLLGVFGFVPYLLFCFVEAWLLLSFAYGMRKIFEASTEY